MSKFRFSAIQSFSPIFTTLYVLPSRGSVNDSEQAHNIDAKITPIQAANSWAYGSPVITCKACRSEYLDKRFREVAIDGFDPRSTNAGFYLKGTAFFFVISLLLVGCFFLQNFTQR